MKILVMSKPGCIWCDRVKELFDMHDLSYDEQCINDPSAQAAFARKHNTFTFPQVFVNDQVIGGYTDVTDWIASGKHIEALHIPHNNNK